MPPRSLPLLALARATRALNSAFGSAAGLAASAGFAASAAGFAASAGLAASAGFDGAAVGGGAAAGAHAESTKNGNINHESRVIGTSSLAVPGAFAPWRCKPNSIRARSYLTTCERRRGRKTEMRELRDEAIDDRLPEQPLKGGETPPL